MAKMVDCPDKEKCGSKKHYQNSEQYKKCLTNSKNKGRSKSPSSTPTPSKPQWGMPFSPMGGSGADEIKASAPEGPKGAIQRMAGEQVDLEIYTPIDGDANSREVQSQMWLVSQDGKRVDITESYAEVMGKKYNPKTGMADSGYEIFDANRSAYEAVEQFGIQVGYAEQWKYADDLPKDSKNSEPVVLDTQFGADMGGGMNYTFDTVEASKNDEGVNIQFRDTNFQLTQEALDLKPGEEVIYEDGTRIERSDHMFNMESEINGIPVQLGFPAAEIGEL